MANVDTISDISNSKDGQQNNPFLLSLAMATAALATGVHSSASPPFFLMYVLLSEFADDKRDVYMNKAIVPSFILINKENMTVKSSNSAKTGSALKAKAPAAKKRRRLMTEHRTIQKWRQWDSCALWKRSNQLVLKSGIVLSDGTLKRSHLDRISTLSEESMQVVTGSPIQLVTHSIVHRRSLTCKAG